LPLTNNAVTEKYDANRLAARSTTSMTNGRIFTVGLHCIGPSRLTAIGAFGTTIVRSGFARLDISVKINVNISLKMTRLVKNTVLILVLLFMAIMSSVLMPSSLVPLRHDSDSGVPSHIDSLLSQKWGFYNKAVTPIRSPSTSVFHAGVHLESELAPMASNGSRPVTAFLASQTAPAHAYLHNPNLRC